MRRFLVESINPKKEVCVLTGQEAKHIGKVLRMRPGDRLILMDLQGLRYQAKIESLSRQAVRVQLEIPLPAAATSALRITVCQALLKTRAMDDMVAKSSELGVACLLPFTSARTVLRPDAAQVKAKMHHWQAIARSATKQSNRAIPLEIASLQPLEIVLSSLKNEQGFKVILWEAEEARSLKGLFRASPFQEQFMGVIGPEGGFTENEVALAQAAGFMTASLGQRILRAETATVTLAAIAQYEWGDLGL